MRSPNELQGEEAEKRRRRGGEEAKKRHRGARERSEKQSITFA